MTDTAHPSTPTAPVNGADRTLPRVVRDTLPLALDVAVEVAKLNGVCIRPIELRRFDTQTGTSKAFDVPCGSTQEAKCPPCAKRNKHLRMAQCREGWHLEAEPVAEPHPSTDDQRWLITFRADVQAKRDQAERDGEDTSDWDDAITGIDAEINAAGMRGNVLGGRTAPRRSRSTRRRQDAPDLPRRARQNTTLGRTFVAPDGKVYRPSLFVTLTLPSYGKIRSGQGVPVDPSTYDYARAARDALHFSKLVDRFVQNLRRVAGYDVQYFATVEPQKRFAPHLHMAIRGTLPRAEIRAIAAATYHQVWWPAADEVRFEGERLPVWVERDEPYPDGQAGDYLDPATGELLPTWDEALDRLDQDEAAEPLHVVRFGAQVDVQAVIAGSPDAHKRIGYLTKYLTKSLGDSLTPMTPVTGHAVTTPPAWSRRCATNPARLPVRTGCGTACSPEGPRRAWSRAGAGARHTGPSTSATRVVACWSPVSGRTRRCGSTGRTGGPGCWMRSGCPTRSRPIRTAMSGGRSPPPTRPGPRWPYDCCVGWPIGTGPVPGWTNSGPERRATPSQIFRQLHYRGWRREEGGHARARLAPPGVGAGPAAHRRTGRRAAGYLGSLPASPDRGTPHHLHPCRAQRPHTRGRT